MVCGPFRGLGGEAPMRGVFPQCAGHRARSHRWVKALHDAFLARGEESPYEQWFAAGFSERADARFTALIDVSDFLHARRKALLAHRTQVDPEGFWMRLPDEVVREVFPWEEFALAESLVDNGVAQGEPEEDLFAGLR